MSTGIAAPPGPPPVKKLNFNISEKAYDELMALSKNTHRSMTELIRLGIGLVKIAIDASQKGQKIVIVNSDGEPVKEIVLP